MAAACVGADGGGAEQQPQPLAGLFVLLPLLLSSLRLRHPGKVLTLFSLGKELGSAITSA